VYQDNITYLNNIGLQYPLDLSHDNYACNYGVGPLSIGHFLVIEIRI